MTGVARPCVPHTMGVDSLAHLTQAQLEDLYRRGVRFVGAYLELLTPPYRDLLFSVGLGIVPLSEAVVGPLGDSMGDSTGATLVRLARNAGVPDGVHLVTDLEDTHGEVSDVFAYCEAKTAAKRIGGYDCMTYVGVPQPLTSNMLSRLSTDRYWRGCSNGIPVPSEEWTLIQLRPGDVTDPNGARVDWNVCEVDAHGRTPVMWWPQ